MEELKEIIVARIKDTHALNSVRFGQGIGDERKLHLSLAVSQRNAETYRCRRQGEILASGQRLGDIDHKTLQQLGVIIGEIIQAYDQEQRSFPVNQPEIFQHLKVLFLKNGFREKLSSLNALSIKKIDKGSCGLILSWLSEWSRKKYCQTLQKGVQMGAISCSTQGPEKPIKTKQPRYESDKEKTLTDQLDRDQSTSKQILLFSRVTVYGCFVEDLEYYYKANSCLQIDFDYLRTIKKRNKKEKLLEGGNLKKAAQVLAETKQNKQIRKRMKQYVKQYLIYQEKVKELKAAKNRVASKSLPKKLPSALRKINSSKNATESICGDLNFAKNKKKYSQNEAEISPEKQRIFEKIRRLQKLQKSSNLKLPPLSRSFEKQSARWHESSIIKFPTQSQCDMIGDADEGGDVEVSGVHFSHRSSIKGIVIRNFISNRETTGKKNQKKSQNKILQNADLVLIGNKSLEKSQKNLSNQTRHICGSVDLRSLREKAKALIKNFKVVRNYQ